MHPQLFLLVGPAPTVWARASAAAVLHRASVLLSRAARRLAQTPAAPVPASREPLLEFHAEAGAPEGALYVDGRLVGWLSGVSRL